MLMRPVSQLKRYHLIPGNIHMFSLIINPLFDVMTVFTSFCACSVFFMFKCIEGVIGGTDYNQSKVNQWTASIVEHSLTHLVKQGRPFKYMGELATVSYTLTRDSVDM